MAEWWTAVCWWVEWHRLRLRRTVPPLRRVARHRRGQQDQQERQTGQGGLHRAWGETQVIPKDWQKLP